MNRAGPWDHKFSTILCVVNIEYELIFFESGQNLIIIEKQ